MKRVAALAVFVLLMPAAAYAQVPTPSPTPTPQQPAPPPPPPGGKLSVKVDSGIFYKGKRFVARGQRIIVKGRVRPFVAGERYVVELFRRGRRVAGRTVEARDAGGKGKFSVAFRVRRSGGYNVKARHDASPGQGRIVAKKRHFRAVGSGARRGSSGLKARLLQRGLARLGYATSRGGHFDDATARAVLAFRKVNGMSRTTRASSTVLRMLIRGAGGYRLRYPNAGKHVEVDISRQVLVLARGGEPERVYHASTGKASTPTVLGSFRFYRSQPGTNANGMVHSRYFIRGYAIHGYPSVPTYPASHGCVRVPIPSALSIYNWIDQGDRIFVYR